jgi:hypothetical protein
MGICFSSTADEYPDKSSIIQLPQQLRIREEYLDDGAMIDVDIYEGSYFVTSVMQKVSRVKQDS